MRRKFVQCLSFDFAANIALSAGQSLCGQARGAKPWCWHWCQVTECTPVFGGHGRSSAASAGLGAVPAGCAKAFHALLHDCIPDIWAPVLGVRKFSYRQELIWLIRLATATAAKEYGLSAALAAAGFLFEGKFGLTLCQNPLVQAQKGLWAQ